VAGRNFDVARRTLSAQSTFQRGYDTMDEPDFWVMMAMAVMIGFLAAMLMFHVI
jgi:hypothetical protein